MVRINGHALLIIKTCRIRVDVVDIEMLHKFFFAEHIALSGE